MGLRTNCYARIWSAKTYNDGKTYLCNVTVSRKKQNGEGYENQFSGFVNMAGEAAKKIATMNLPEKNDKNGNYKTIKISDSIDITTYFDAEKYKKLLVAANGNPELESFVKNNSTRHSITIWNFDADGGNSTPAPTPAPVTATTTKAAVAVDDDLPF